MIYFEWCDPEKQQLSQLEKETETTHEARWRAKIYSFVLKWECVVSVLSPLATSIKTMIKNVIYYLHSSYVYLLLAVQAINDSRTLSLPTSLSLFVMDNDDS